MSGIFQILEVISYLVSFFSLRTFAFSGDQSLSPIVYGIYV